MLQSAAFIRARAASRRLPAHAFFATAAFGHARCEPPPSVARASSRRLARAHCSRNYGNLLLLFLNSNPVGRTGVPLLRAASSGLGILGGVL